MHSVTSRKVKLIDVLNAKYHLKKMAAAPTWSAKSANMNGVGLVVFHGSQKRTKFLDLSARLQPKA